MSFIVLNAILVACNITSGTLRKLINGHRSAPLPPYQKLQMFSQSSFKHHTFNNITLNILNTQNKFHERLFLESAYIKHFTLYYNTLYPCGLNQLSNNKLTLYILRYQMHLTINLFKHDLIINYTNKLHVLKEDSHPQPKNHLQN